MMLNGKIRRGQNWLRQELEGGGRDVLLHLAMGGLVAADVQNVRDNLHISTDYGRLSALFRWASEQPEADAEKLKDTVNRLPAPTDRQHRVLLREIVSRSSHPSFLQ